jgi:hypothetical protein
MARLLLLGLCSALTGCGAASVRTDLETDRASAQLLLETILPADMTISRSELLSLDKGTGILLHASPEDKIWIKRMQSWRMI